VGLACHDKLLGELLPCGQGVGNVAKRCLDRAFVFGNGDVTPHDANVEIGLSHAGTEDR